MLERIDITGFEIVNGTVVTQFRINRIPVSNTGTTSSSALMNTLSTPDFRANVLNQTVAAIVAEPESSWTADPVFSNSVPTDA